MILNREVCIIANSLCMKLLWYIINIMNDSMTDKFIMVTYRTSSILRSSVVLSQFDIQYWINNLHAQYPVSTMDFWLWKLLLISRFAAERRMGKHRNIPPGHHLLLVVVNSLPQIIDKTSTNRHYQLGHCVHREQCMTELMSYINHTYCIAGKFGGELNLAVWQISHPATKLKSTNFSHAKAIWSCTVKQIDGCGLCTNLVPSITHLNHFYHVSLRQGLFSISLLVQDNLSRPMVGNPNTMMPLYAALHTICLASHSPTISSTHAHAADSRRG